MRRVLVLVTLRINALRRTARTMRKHTQVVDSASKVVSKGIHFDIARRHEARMRLCPQHLDWICRTKFGIPLGHSGAINSINRWAFALPPASLKGYRKHIAFAPRRRSINEASRRLSDFEPRRMPLVVEDDDLPPSGAAALWV